MRLSKSCLKESEITRMPFQVRETPIMRTDQGYFATNASCGRVIGKKPDEISILEKLCETASFRDLTGCKALFLSAFLAGKSGLDQRGYPAHIDPPCQAGFQDAHDLAHLLGTCSSGLGKCAADFGQDFFLGQLLRQI